MSNFSSKLSSPISIIGGGCVGLSIALTLLQHGFSDITVVAEEFSPHTTSDGAAAVWRPFMMSNPLSRSLVHEWGKETFETINQFRKQYGSERTGIRWIPGFEILEQNEEHGYFSEQVIAFKVLTSNEKCALGISDHLTVWSYTSLLLEMPIYMRFLMDQIRSLGGKFASARVDSFSQASLPAECQNASLIINATGMGAKALTLDNQIVSARGQLSVVEPFGLHHFYVYSNNATHEHTYCIPRSNDCIFGGTFEFGNESKEVDPATKADIFRRVTELVPELSKRKSEIKMIRDWVGLRPCRDSPRVEFEPPFGSSLIRKTISPTALDRSNHEYTNSLQSNCSVPLIHCYGHGGSGATLHFGSAMSVLRLVQSHVLQIE